MTYRLEMLPYRHTEEYVVELEFMFGDADGHETIEVVFNKDELDKVEQFIKDVGVLWDLDPQYGRLGYHFVGDLFYDSFVKDPETGNLVRVANGRRSGNKWESYDEWLTYYQSLPEWLCWFGWDHYPANDEDLGDLFPYAGSAQWPHEPVSDVPASLQRVQPYYYDDVGNKYKLIEVDENGNDVIK